MAERTLVLNSSYQVVGIIPWDKAINHLYEGDAETVKEWDDIEEKYVGIEYDKTLSNVDKKYVWKIPAIIKLKDNNVFPKYGVKFSKLNVLYRDDFTCMYCGFQNDHSPFGRRRKLTIDHIIPQSKGGKSTFENCVCACEDCNGFKANKSLEELDMKLLRKPFVPKSSMRLQKKIYGHKIHKSWEKYMNNSFS